MKSIDFTKVAEVLGETPRMKPLVKYIIALTESKGMANHPLELTSWFMEDIDLILKTLDKIAAQEGGEHAN